MGRAKDEWMRSQERGWDAPDKYVCGKCFEDEYLSSVAQTDAEEPCCDYCGREDKAGNPISAPLSALLKPIAKALFARFEEPGAAGLPRDTGEWIGEERITDTYDALLSLPLNCEAELFEDIARSFHNTAWYPCAKGFWLDLHKHVELEYSWAHFVEYVKHQSRYFFGLYDGDREERNDDPLSLLQEIGSLSESLGIIRTVPAMTSLFRVRRSTPGTSYDSFEDLGPPPSEIAAAGRMNPAGISYFYLALEAKTALAETLEKPPIYAVLATFTTKLDIRVLDLAELPPIPSVFDGQRYETREVILFLDRFVSAISQPTIKDGREHIDYVPSQVVSEFFAQVFSLEDRVPLDGIVYPSALLPGGRNIVLFPSRNRHRQLDDIVALEGTFDIQVKDWMQLLQQLDPGS